MKNSILSKRKIYAMRRMGLAIDRAVEERTPAAKERAAKWAAAWGLLVGLHSRKVRLKPAHDVVSVELSEISSALNSTENPTAIPIGKEWNKSA